MTTLLNADQSRRVRYEANIANESPLPYDMYSDLKVSNARQMIRASIQGVRLDRFDLLILGTNGGYLPSCQCTCMLWIKVLVRLF